jgi:N-acetylglucosaminyldiphosphoundecaprenol N-acetyl-beta-D-mannosaminyltransferase
VRQTTNIFGFDFICDATYEQLSDEIISDVASGRMGITSFITPNAHGINMYSKYPELNAYAKASRYVLPDGQPIVWISKFTKHPIKQRLTGSDFFPVMFRKLKAPQHKCLFVVSTPLIRDKFLAEKPDAFLLIPDFFEMSDQEKIDETGDKMVNVIIANKINYVFTGISEPKQGALGQNVTKKLNALGYKEPCLFFFLGASFEFYFDLKKRAPELFRKTGMEWFYRLITEPRRMYKRYIFGNIVFLFRAARWLLSKK